MKNIEFPVIFTSLFLLGYVITLSFPIAFSPAFVLFMFSQALVVWMVYRVLRYGVASEKKFSDGHWYDDYNINQVGVDKIEMIGQSSED